MELHILVHIRLFVESSSTVLYYENTHLFHETVFLFRWCIFYVV